MSILILLPFLVIGMPAQEENTYSNDDLQIRLALPGEGFETKSYDLPGKGDLWGWTGTIYEFRHPDLLLHGILLYSKAAMRVQRYADWRERQWKLHNKQVKRLDQREVQGKKGTWLVREFWVETQDNEFHYHHVFINDGRHNFELIVWSPDAVWEENKESAMKIVESLAYGEAAVKP